jgi:ribosomal protein L5
MYTPRLKEKYDKQIVPAMQEKFGYKNSMMVPKLLRFASTKELVKLLLIRN